MARITRRMHDCFGSVLLVEGTTVSFICAHCTKTSQVLDASGLHSTAKHGSDKHPNFVPLVALELAIAEVKRRAGGKLT